MKIKNVFIFLPQILFFFYSELIFTGTQQSNLNDSIITNCSGIIYYFFNKSCDE